jgi:hypothetical protein
MESPNYSDSDSIDLRMIHYTVSYRKFTHYYTVRDVTRGLLGYACQYCKVPKFEKCYSKQTAVEEFH